LEGGVVDGVRVEGVAAPGELEGGAPALDDDPPPGGAAARLACASSPSDAVKTIERNLSMAQSSDGLIPRPAAIGGPRVARGRG
jgi:hypothetical protein